MRPSGGSGRRTCIGLAPAPEMRVALLLRPDADQRPGGDVVQARAIARYLRGRGADVQEVKGWRPSLAGFDLGIVMNLTVPEQAWLHATACRRHGLPYLLLPVFWDLAAAVPHQQRPTADRMLPVGSWRRGAAQRLRLAAAAPGHVLETAGRHLPRYLAAHDRELVRRVVAGALVVCPNSASELTHLADHVGATPDERWRIVHNGLWVDELPPLDEVAGSPRDDVLLSVGAVSPRKNTLGLVRAARQLDVQVVLIGQHPRAADAYATRVLAEAPDNVRFTGLLPRAEVLVRLSRARAHVQPGFVETPGLASLEALALATPVVVSDTGPVREYFAEDACYANPHDVDSLAAALLRALEAGPQPGPAARIRREFDWEVALAPIADVLPSGGS